MNWTCTPAPVPRQPSMSAGTQRAEDRREPLLALHLLSLACGALGRNYSLNKRSELVLNKLSGCIKAAVPVSLQLLPRFKGSILTDLGG